VLDVFVYVVPVVSCCHVRSCKAHSSYLEVDATNWR